MLATFLLVLVLGACARPSTPVYQGEPLAHWLGLLTSQDYRERNRAEAALGGIGPEALPELVRALRSRESPLVDLYQAAVDKVVPRKRPRTPIKRLHEQAALLLARLGPRAEPAVPALIRSLAGPDADAVRASQMALRRVGPGAVPHLIGALKDASPAVRCQAAELLGDPKDYGEAAGMAVKPLIAALRDPEPTVRAQAAMALGAIRPAFEPAVRALAEALTDRFANVRVGAARALAQAGPSARPAVALLAACLADAHPLVRVEAARALWRITGETRPSLPILIAALLEPQAHWQAALALGEMGPAADGAIPALLQALEREITHRPSRTPASAALALARMSPAAVPGLVALLRHEAGFVRVGAALALAGHGPAARAAIPGLRQMLTDPDPEARMAATNTLGAIGPEAREALPSLNLLAQDSDEYLRANAQAAINRIAGPPTLGLAPLAGRD